MNNIDATESEFKMFSFVVKNQGKKWCGNIPARSFKEVKKFIPKAEEIGILVETQPVGIICSICSGDMRIEEQAPIPVDDNWDDLLDE